MKITKFLKIITLIILVPIITECSNGGGDNPIPSQTPSKCEAQTSTELTAFNVFDGTLGSPYYGVAIANFKFSQELNTYSNNCKPDQYNNTSLKIANGTSKVLSFSYLIVATIGIVTWQYQDVATISPNGSIDVGVINSNHQEFHLAVVSIRLANITYK